MKIKSILTVILAAAFLSAVTGCKKSVDEITELNLARCLQPTNLSAKVVSTKGNVIVFNWDTGKDTDAYELYIYSDAKMEKEYKHFTLAPSQVPDSVTVDADASYWFKVQATSLSREASKWAEYGKEIKTYAVKSALYPEVISRDESSVTLQWSTDVADYKEVTHITYAKTSDGEAQEYKLSDSEIAAGVATIKGLKASTEYGFGLYYLSASRGELVAWTTPDVSGMTEVSDLAALQNAIKTSGARILLKMEGSPYAIDVCDISNGFSIYGEESVDGTKPVLQGEFHFSDTWKAGESVYFEGVEFNGCDSKYGFAIQKKNGGSSANAEIGSIIYKNCVITGYSKGLIYEWGKTMTIGELTWQDCVISSINKDGTQGGDVIDIRNASSISKLNIVNNTIYQGMRTFLRFDAAPTLGDVKIENNTLQNLCFVDNTNNAGIFGLQVAPSSISFKKNLFLNFVSKSVLGSENTKYKTADDIALSGSDNWFYNVHDAFFTTSYPQTKAGYNLLSTDPCYNAKGGVFNIKADSDIAGAEVGASKWWAPYTEKPEDLTLNCLEGPYKWDFTDAKYFSWTAKKHLVRQNLYVAASESLPITATGELVSFSDATQCSSKGVPQDGFLKFKTHTPGSVVLLTEGGSGSNVVVATSTVDGVVKIVGGVATLESNTTPTKVVISDTTEAETETTVFLYSTGAISLKQLAWSEDVSPVNTALPSPVPSVEPAYMTAGEATDVTVSWEAVPNAGSYTVKFGKNEYSVEEGALSYVIPGKTTTMLDKGSYNVMVYAHPLATDIYNTVSEAGTTSFAVLPSGGGGETELVVKTVDELKSAITAGKTAITLDAAEFDLSADTEWGGTLPIAGPLALTGLDGAKVKGALSISGEVGDVSIDNISFTDCGKGCFITLLETPAVVATSINVTRCTLDGYTKSAIYANFATSSVDKVSFIANTIQNQGAGQGIFDFRKGTYGQISLVGNTVIGGRDFIRMDSACAGGTVDVSNNTFDGVTLDNGNGVLYVRAKLQKYTVFRNLFLNEVKTEGKTFLSKASGVTVPTNMSTNYFYNIDGKSFLSGMIDSTTATFKGAILGASPVKDLAAHDYTLTNGVLIADKVGAPQWQPSLAFCDKDKITVKNAEEFKAAIEAGKVEIILAAEGSPYTFGESSAFEVPANLHLVGESGSHPEFHGYFNMSGTEDLGTVIFDNIDFCGDAALGCVLNVTGTPVAKTIQMLDCTVDGFTKSVYYGSAAATVQALVFNGVAVLNHGTGQGVFDLRKGAYGTVDIENCTVVGGRDLIRADAGTITDCFRFSNNTVDGSNAGVNGNGIMYVRATPTAFKFTNNLFINEIADGKTVLWSKASGVTVPTEASKNFVWNYDETNFFSGLLNKETGGAVTITNCPVKDAANGDYTLVDGLLLSSNIGAREWNPNAGHSTSEYTASTVDELLTAIGAGKTAITLKYGEYNFGSVVDNPAVSSGILTLTAPISLIGEKYAGKYPVIKGAFKLGEGVTEFTANRLAFDADTVSLKLGNLFELTATSATEISRIDISNCDVSGYSKSLYYASSAATANIDLISFRQLLVSGMGTGQGMFDIRAGAINTLSLQKSTIYNGGRDLIRADKNIVLKSVAITYNTFSATGLGAGNGLLWVRSAPESYVVANNLFLNEVKDGAKTLLAKTGATKASFANNFYFNIDATNFWTGTYTQEEGTANGGAVLEADPCAGSASGNFKLTNQELKKLGVGDPRWR